MDNDGAAETPEAGRAKAPAAMIHLTVNPYMRSRKVTAMFETVDPAEYALVNPWIPRL
jgi:hypothetical protein